MARTVELKAGKQIPVLWDSLWTNLLRSKPLYASLCFRSFSRCFRMTPMERVVVFPRKPRCFCCWAMRIKKLSLRSRLRSQRKVNPFNGVLSFLLPHGVLNICVIVNAKTKIRRDCRIGSFVGGFLYRDYSTFTHADDDEALLLSSSNRGRGQNDKPSFQRNYYSMATPIKNYYILNCSV